MCKLVKKKKIDIKFVITGNPSNNKDNEIYNEFVNNISKLNLDSTFYLLGFVPYDDVISLIYHAKILVNPSLFEGWSTTVEEGKIFNKKMILSDLKIHKEQSLSNTLFFNPKKPEELAQKIIKIYKTKKNYLKLSLIRKNYTRNRTLFAKNFLNVVKNSL